MEEKNDGTKRYKARLVVKSFQQREGIDFIKNFFYVVKLTTIRFALNIVTAEDYI